MSTNQHQHHPVAQALAVIAGAATTAQSRVNGELALVVGSGWEAAAISFGTGLIFLTLLACFMPPVRLGLRKVVAAVRGGELRWWQVIGGTVGAAFVATQSLSVPLVGVAVFTIATIGAQTASSLVVDRTGIGPQGVIHPTRNRIIAAVVAIFAVGVSVSDRLGSGSFALWAVLAALAVGAAVSFQHAFNGHVSRVAGHPVTAAWLNFITGSTALFVIVGAMTVTGTLQLSPLPAGPWYLYLGGFLGLWFIITAARVIHLLGALRFALGSVSGQLVGAVLFDVFAPANGIGVTTHLLAGVAMTAAAVVLANLKPRS